jgi:hypothetical protein
MIQNRVGPSPDDLITFGHQSDTSLHPEDREDGGSKVLRNFDIVPYPASQLRRTPFESSLQISQHQSELGFCVIINTY